MSGVHAPERQDLVARWYADGTYGSTTIGEEILAAPASGTVVFADAGSTTTVEVAALRDRAARLACGLVASGLQPGDVVAIQAPISADSMALTAAVWIAGGVLLPIVDIYGRHEVTFILRQSGARILAVPTQWRGRSYASEALGWGDDRPETVVAIGASPPAGAVALTELELDGAPGPSGPVRADDIALLVYTSGTTSEPKGVQHTHNSLLAGGFRSADRFGLALTNLGTFPAGHIAGVLSVLRPFLHGGTTVIMERWSARRAAELVEEHRVVSSSGTPFYLATLLDEAERSGRDISSLQRFLTGAASVPPALLERATRAGIVSWRSYGSTEHPLISSGRPEHTERQRHLTDGAVSPGVEVRILDDAGRDLPAGADGEIVVRGPKQFVGYRDPALDADAFLPGCWFRTGDVGRLDSDGHLTITDRKKDVIIRGGENISSREIEDLLARHDAVSEVAVCAAPDPVFGEQVCAFVVLRPGASLDPDDVLAHFSALGVARQKVPTRLEIVDDLPRTASGKVRKVDLRRMAARG
jgi:acyl-CoA synthetase (AMP-forming)/AMP-acid ligase II